MELTSRSHGEPFLTQLYHTFFRCGLMSWISPVQTTVA